MANSHRISHGHARRGRCSNEYISWHNMISRCKSPKHKNWADYGGRGINVCLRWHTFANFLADMGFRQEGMELDRINNNGNYEPGNCRWVTHQENCRNRRRQSQQRKHIGPPTKDGHFISGAIRHKIKRGKEIESGGPRIYPPRIRKHIGPLTRDGHFLSAGLRYWMWKGLI